MQVPGPKQPSFAAAAAAQSPPAAAAAPAAAPKKRGHHAVPYEGDVSEWGKTQLEGFYDESDVEAEPNLSSAISPRDSRPRLRSFNMEEATETLAYQSGMFSRAQALRRDGCAPAAMGVPDDLPTRMAYQQLHVLAGMAGKVQDAILHNKRIFEQRMMSDGRALQRRVLHGWLVLMQQKAAKRSRLARAAGRLQRGLLLRVFYSWKDELHHVDKTLVMKRKVAAVTARGCVRRCFMVWLFLAKERWYKSQMSSMESQVGLMEAKLRGYEKRPIQVLRKRRLSHLLSAWLVEAVWSRYKRERVAKAQRLCRHNQQQRAWTAWGDYVAVKGRQRMLAQQVAKGCQAIRQQTAWGAWLQAVELKHVQQQQLQLAAQHHTRTTCVKVWRAWQSRAKQHRSSRAAANRWKRPCMARAFKFWLWYAGKQKRQRVVLARTQAKRQKQLAVAAFSCWQEYVQHRHLKVQLGETQGLQDELERLKAENARLQRDNERFVRLVDSGEWGRGRVAELTSAGELMRAERDALLKLVQALRREYEAVQLAKEAQHDELRSLKDKMTVKGAARNCLLVKGGSSFNALVRALKQDLIDSGTAAKDPALLYQIDKLSLDRVQVYPDGELNIQAVTSGPQGPSKGAPQQHSQPGSPAHLRAPPSPQRQPTLGSPGDAVNPRLRVATGTYGSSPSSTGGSMSGLQGSPTQMGAASGAFYSPKADSLSGSPLRQPGLRAVSAAAAAAAAAVVSGRPGAGMGSRPALRAATSSPSAGHAPCQAFVPTDSMLHALSNLTPAQVQRLAAAGQQQVRLSEPRLLSTAPAGGGSSSHGSPAAKRAGPRS